MLISGESGLRKRVEEVIYGNLPFKTDV